MSGDIDAEVDWIESSTSAQLARRAELAFAEVFSATPDGVWAAPGRVNLIGEHLDYNGGPVLPLAIPHRTAVAAAGRCDGRVRLRSAQDPTTWDGSMGTLVPGRVPGWCAYAAGVLWAMREAGQTLTGIDLLIDSDVPFGAGLSSSAALTCAVVLAATELSARSADAIERRTLAAWCVRAENEFAGAPTGGMDQAVVLRARADHAFLLDCSTFDAEHLAMPTDGELLVVDTRTHHALVDGKYGGRRQASERAAAELGVAALAQVESADLGAALETLGDAELRGVVRHVVTETARVRDVAEFLRADRLAEIGALMLQSHASMRDDMAISTPELDLAVKSAMNAGALGARMTGGGFGGSAVVLVRPGERVHVAEYISRAFSQAGCAHPGIIEVHAAQAADRIA
ncbi:MAG: galactokinase [Ornithinimicrobium sp.]